MFLYIKEFLKAFVQGLGRTKLMETRRFNKLLNSISTNEESFNELYQFYGRRIVFHLIGIYGKGVAEDAMQDFFLKLISGDKKYDYIEKPTSWVYKCCENIAKTKIRLDSKYEPLYDNAEFREKFFDNLELKIELNKLDNISRRIIELFYWDGYNLEEISEILHIKYATIRQKHRRVKVRLKKILGRLSQN